jgi:hypothetical protein
VRTPIERVSILSDDEDEENAALDGVREGHEPVANHQGALFAATSSRVSHPLATFLLAHATV